MENKLKAEIKGYTCAFALWVNSCRTSFIMLMSQMETHREKIQPTSLVLVQAPVYILHWMRDLHLSAIRDHTDAAL